MSAKQAPIFNEMMNGVDTRAAYFVPRRSGPFWDAIRDAGAMALFTPSEFADAEFELLAPTPG